MPWTTNPEVVYTELDEGAVLLNMETRLYYSLDEAGVVIWKALDEPAEQEALAQALAARFAVDAEHARHAASRFLDELQRERLAVPGPEGSTSEPAIQPASEMRRLPFAEPQLIRHDEPLHEVSLSPFDPQLPLAE